MADGYTAAAQSDLVTKNAKFNTAIQALELYINDMEKMPGQGRADPLIADLLVDWAGVLIDAIAADATP